MNDSSSKAERRTERRVPCRFTLSIRKSSGEGGLASAVDLSPKGMRFQYVGEHISLTEKVLVQFNVSSRTYSFCGLPVRVASPAPFAQEVALLFQAVDERARELLRRAISSGLESSA